MRVGGRSKEGKKKEWYRSIRESEEITKERESLRERMGGGEG